MNEKVEFYKETNFKETTIGKIPKDWEVIRLSSITEIIMGQSPPSSTYNKLNPAFSYLHILPSPRVQEKTWNIQLYTVSMF